MENPKTRKSQSKELFFPDEKATKNIGLEHFNLFHLSILKIWPSPGIYEQRTK